MTDWNKEEHPNGCSFFIRTYVRNEHTFLRRSTSQANICSPLQHFNVLKFYSIKILYTVYSILETYFHRLKH